MKWFMNINIIFIWIKPGDILLINKDEYVNADVLILDASERYFDVNTSKINGSSSL